MGVGPLGLRLIEGWGLVAFFYFMALLPTGEGPAATPATDVGKIFAAIMAFFSIGAAISAITFTFGPLFGSVLKEGARYLEKEEDRLKDKLERKNSDPKTHSCRVISRLFLHERHSLHHWSPPFHLLHHLPHREILVY